MSTSTDDTPKRLCHGFISPPWEITVGIDGSSRMGMDLGHRIHIVDPDGDTYMLTPASARERASLIEKTADSDSCLDLARRIRAAASEAEAKADD